ncbi:MULTISPECIES: ABC transporter permease [unclassified Streptomyces]|uniref:ABC transporter permease n=1 Tax=unclassified Streptomyces TaxID=2593676 RepID=UPI001F045BEA|nr:MULTISPECIES: ABC transporter permease [unclassified Streptomyces]MCH0567084.1 ABC transporter permease [Streptomyces sp. MUM 2J]MCH0569814.1 ABC transporter permease [Streptomyces sp. MUM 136J]
MHDGEQDSLLWPVVRAVWLRELLLFRRYWPAVTFGSLVEPLIYIAGFGLGFRQLIGSATGQPYLQFLSTGMIATAVLFSSVFTGMFETYNRRQGQKVYDAILSRPVDVWELVSAESSWIAAKSGVYGSAPLFVALTVGLPLRPQLLLVPPVALLAGLGFALCGMWVSCIVPAIDWLRLIASGVLTPLVMAAGVFFPLDGLPGWARAAALVNPMYHCTELVRHCSFGTLHTSDAGHATFLLVLCAVAWRLAVRAMRRRLLD